MSLDVIGATFAETVDDFKEGFRNKDIPAQTSTLLLRLSEGFFGAFTRKWKPIAFRPEKNIFTGFIDHVSHPKKLLSVGFMTQLAQEFFPPQVAPRYTGKTISLDPNRFAPYDTEMITFPLVIYVTIGLLILFFIILLVEKSRRRTLTL